MAIGKREQVVGLSISVLASIFLIHLLIFKPKADEFAEVQARHQEGTQKLASAMILPSPNFLKKEDEKTSGYQNQLSQVTSQLNIAVPDHFKEDKPENFQKRLDEMLASVRELLRLRDSGQAPKLSFLGDRKFPQNPYLQLGWNLPSRLPIFEQVRERNQARARLWDLITQLENHWTVANNISDPEQRMQYRTRYNEYLMQLGLNPIELSDFYYQADQNSPMIFFNDKRTYEQLLGKAQVNNTYSINRYGVFLPEIKRMWMLELIWAEKDQNTRITRDKLHQVLEIKLPFDEKMMFINKQLQSLVDIVKMANKANVQEITEVHMLKPADFAKQPRREPQKGPGATAAATPGPDGAAAAAPAGGSTEKVARGAGLEIYFLGTNPATFDFLFEVTTLPRTYALDDLYVHAMQGNVLFTSATVEMVMKLESGQMAPPPGAGGPGGAPAPTGDEEARPAVI